MKSIRIVSIVSSILAIGLILALPATSVQADILLSQLDGRVGEGFGLASGAWEPGFEDVDSEGADDFVVPSGFSWTIEQIFFEGQSQYTDGSTPPIEAAHLRIYADNGGLPGAVLQELLNQPTVGNAQHDFTLDTSVQLDAGTYWFSVQAFLPDAGWIWSRREPATGQNGVWRNPLDGYASGHTDWTPIPDLSFVSNNPVSSDLVFEIRGTVTSVPEPSSALLLSIPALGAVMIRRRAK